MKKSDTLRKYTDKLHNTSFSIPHYRSKNLKAKLMKSYKQRISLVQFGSKKKYLLHSSIIETGFAVIMAYQLSTADTASDVVMQLRNNIKGTYKEAEDLK